MIRPLIQGDHTYDLRNRVTGQAWRVGLGMALLESLADLAKFGREMARYGPNDSLQIIDNGSLFDACPLKH
jgi:hypothetical protein